MLNKENNTKNYNYSEYLVSYVDILGQKNLLRTLIMPKNQNEMENTISILRSTAGVIISFREMFEKTFELYSKPSPDLLIYPENIRSKIIQLRKTDIRFHGFSDSVIISLTLANNNDNCKPIMGIYGILFTLCSVYLTMLAIGHPIRGGIDIGPCLSLSENEVYGAALERAYCIESNIADYPRIVIGDGLYNYLNEIKYQNENTIPGQLAKMYADNCLKLLKRDYDNCLTLDYLGEEVIKILNFYNNSEMPIWKVFLKAKEFINRKLIEFNKKDKKLYKRYSKVMKYMKSYEISIGKLMNEN